MDVIIVLGGNIIKEGDSWRTTTFKEKDQSGVLGDRLRVVAAGYLFKKNPKLKIIASGNMAWPVVKNSPTIAEIMKKELVELGVPPENIIEDKKSNGTYSQLKNCFEISDGLKLISIGIISNDYHLPRIRAFLKYAPGISRKVLLISAEKILISEDLARWKNEILEAYQSKSMKERVAFEKKGTRDLKLGKYKFN